MKDAIITSLCVVTLILPMTAAFAKSTGARADSDSIELRVVDARVWLDAQEADLNDVLQRLAEAGGVRLWLSERLPAQSVSARFDEEPLQAVLKQLLERHSYALELDPETQRVTGVFVLAPREAPPAAPMIGSYGDPDAVLREALASPRLPDSLKLALLAQQDGNRTARRALEGVTRTEVMGRLVDQLDAAGHIDPEIMLRLREALEELRSEP